MGDEIIGALFESNGAGLLDSETSHLLTELESMTSDPNQPAPRTPQAQTQQFYDYSGGMGLQLSPQSPAQSLQSPGSAQPANMMPPSPQQHYGSPPPQQLQRQMSQPHQYPNYPPQPMQGSVTSPVQPGMPQTAGAQSMWHTQHHPGYPQPAVPQSPQRGGYSNMGPPRHVPPQSPGASSAYMTHQHGMPPGQYPSHQYQQMGGQMDPYGHLVRPQMSYPSTPEGYMHPGIRGGRPSMPQHLPSQQTQQSQLMIGQPRMPRPGQPYPQPPYMMQQRMPSSPAGQRMMSHEHMQAQHASMMASGADPQIRMPPGYRGHLPTHPYSQSSEMIMSQAPQYHSSAHQPPPGYGYQSQQMVSPRTPIPSQHPAANNPPTVIQQQQPQPNYQQQIEQQQQQQPLMSPPGPSTPTSTMQNQYGHMHSPHSAQMSPGFPHSQSSQMYQPSSHSMSQNNPMLSPQHGVPHQMQHQQHIQQQNQQQQQQQMISQQPPALKKSPIESLDEEILMVENHLNHLLQTAPPPQTAEHQIMTIQERLRSLNCQKQMILDDYIAEKAKQALGPQPGPTPAEPQPKTLKDDSKPSLEPPEGNPPNNVPMETPLASAYLESDQQPKTEESENLNNDSQASVADSQPAPSAQTTESVTIPPVPADTTVGTVVTSDSSPSTISPAAQTSQSAVNRASTATETLSANQTTPTTTILQSNPQQAMIITTTLPTGEQTQLVPIIGGQLLIQQPDGAPTPIIPAAQPGLRTIAPHPGGNIKIRPALQINQAIVGLGDVPTAPPQAMPELLEDPKSSIGSSSDIPSMVNSPALSESSIPTPGGRRKKGGARRGGKGNKRPPASLLKQMRRKRRHSSDMSDLDSSPPPSVKESENDLAVLGHRRSERVTKRTKYVDELQLDLSDDDKPPLNEDDNSTMGDLVGGGLSNQLVVDKILGRRMGSRTVTSDSVAAGGDNEGKKEETVQIEEYFVKYKNYSFLHCEWKTSEELEKTDKRIKLKLKRYHQKQAAIPQLLLSMTDEDELFNPEYVEVERVLAVSRQPAEDNTGNSTDEVVHYLVKWRQLPYEDSTWELEQDVDKTKIELYEKWNTTPALCKRVPMPEPSQWKALPKDKIYKGDNLLREYQFEGVSWLLFCYYNRQNCILADEMGLGKTVQSITYLQSVIDYGITQPFLVIAPLSTIGNWLREFDAWTDMNVIVYHGSSTSRSMIQDYEMFYKDDSGRIRFDAFKFNAVITTYEVVMQDLDVLSQIEWRCCVIDEAHRLKNKNCKLMEGLRCFNLEHKVLLSGTPLQNNVEELFSLLNFLEPNRFKSSIEFMSEFGDLKTESQVEKLKAILKPMMLRRLKEDVEKNLAPKEETIIEVELTNIQKKYYRAILEKNFSFLTKGGTTANVPNLMNTMMELRKCCNHPYLMNGAEEQIVVELKDTIGGRDPSSDMLIDKMVQGSGKLVLLDKLLPKLKSGNHKVLIFSQMIRVLDILEDYLVQRQYVYERIDGRIRGNQRQEAIDRFSRPDSDRFVFLLCTRAGGLGINLTAADTCIIYDSDWNPQNDLQAQARCHRIGQQKAVKVYRLLCKNTYEREMFDKASLKLGLDKAVLQNMGGVKENAEKANAPMSKQEVENLLKKGAYGALMEDDKSGDRFCEEDIDQILQRRTQIITVESVGKGSTFAKASFSSSGTRDDIDINDPEFWQKWAKKADIETNDDKNELIIEEPRRRKQTKRFGGGEPQIDEISEIDSSSDSDADKKSSKRRGRRKPDDDFEVEDKLPALGCYTRHECFKVEKLLMVYGWGRWTSMAKHARFKRELDEIDIRNISQSILLYSLKHYNGDQAIKNLIWELAIPSDDGPTKSITNHFGLAAPSTKRKGRGRGKEDEDEPVDAAAEELEEKILSCSVNTEAVLSDNGYRKHLMRHANKVLLRVRMLYYLQSQLIGDQEEKLFNNTPWTGIIMPNPPKPEGDAPVPWWTKDQDRCLLLGVFKHGYEKYNLIRADECLCFLQMCGPPDGVALAKEQNDEEDDENDPDTPVRPSSRIDTPDPTNSKLPFPTSSDLNTRLRRLIAAYQKSSRRRLDAAAAAEKRAQIRQVNVRRIEKPKAKWTRREEADFYRVISTFGLETDPDKKQHDNQRVFIWDNFRMLANITKKDDEQLYEYLEAFVFMCKRVSGRLQSEEAENPPMLIVESISEERAVRCINRLELLTKIREEVLWHNELTQRLRLCQYSPEIPWWWKPGEHDKDLLIGAAKHGLAHTDQHILYDSKLCFKDLLLKSLTEPNRPIKTDKHKPSSSETSAHNSKHEHMDTNDNGLKPDIKKEDNSEDQPDDIKSEDRKSEDRKLGAGDRKSVLVNGDSHTDNSTLDQSNGRESDTNENNEENEEENLKQESKVLNGERSKSRSISERKSSEKSATSNPVEEQTKPFYWPKDKVIIQRLELVCYCIESGEWPTASTSRSILSNSGLDTPTLSPTQSRTNTPSHSEYSCAMDDEEQQVEGLRMTISRNNVGRPRKPKRCRLDMEVDRIARLRDGGESECSQSTPLRGTPDSLINGGIYGSAMTGLTAEELLSPYRPRTKKRGRKSKADKIAEMQLATQRHAVISAYQKLASLDIDGDVRIPCTNLEDNTRLSGEAAPQRRDLERFLTDHPMYLVEIPDTLTSSSSSSQGALATLSTDKKSKKVKTETDLEQMQLTGAENVSVINRETGKKISGSKAPTLLNLSDWLEKNPLYDVDSRWSAIIRSQGNLPESISSRLQSDKRKKKASTAATTSASEYDLASTLAAQQQAAAAQAFMAASMSGYGQLGQMNQLAAMQTLAAMGVPASMMSLYGLCAPTDTTTDEETLKALAGVTSTHSAFPYAQMYNPLLAYSSMLAASGMGGMSASAASQSYAQQLASASLLNGMLGLDPTQTSGEMTTEMAEKLTAMSSEMTAMDDLTLRARMMEEFYNQTAKPSTSTAQTQKTTSREPGSREPGSREPSSRELSSREPGETSPVTKRKTTTVIKSTASAATHDDTEDMLPEDLSVKRNATPSHKDSDELTHRGENSQSVIKQTIEHKPEKSENTSLERETASPHSNDGD